MWLIDKARESNRTFLSVHAPVALAADVACCKPLYHRSIQIMHPKPAAT